jgi:outer membrane protein
MVKRVFVRSLSTIVTAIGLAAGAEAQSNGAESSALRWGVGGGFIVSPRPYVGANPHTFPIPVVEVRYRRWFFQGIRGGYDLSPDPRWNVNAFAQVRFQGLEPDDSAFLSGMDERRRSMDGGVEVAYRGRPVGFRAVASTDVLGRSNGQELGAQAVTGAPVGKKLLVLGGFGPRWESGRRIDYYYGVRPEEATDERPAYSGEATLSWDLAVSAIYRPFDRWTVFALVNRTWYGDGIRRSSTVERESVSSLVLFVTRSF